MQIVGVSFDEPAENDAWGVQHAMPFELWSDHERELALYYGAATSPTQSRAKRRTFLLGEDGAVILAYPQVSVGTHPLDVLEDCQVLFDRS